VIKAVIFDLGGVVLKGNLASFKNKSEKILGVKAKPGTEALFDKKLNLGTSSLRAAFERVFGKKMFDGEFLPVIKAWMANWEIDEKLLSFAKKLGKRYNVAILSNSDLSYEEKYGERLAEVFPTIVYSHRARMLKPNKEIFEHTLKKLGLEPEECIMVDDVQENIRAAKELGMHAVQFRNFEKLKKDLELQGVRA